MKLIYPKNLDPRTLEPHFSRHMLALTAEGLHDKSAIAEQLAWRDQQIELLKSSLQKLGATIVRELASNNEDD